MRKSNSWLRARAARPNPPLLAGCESSRPQPASGARSLLATALLLGAALLLALPPLAHASPAPPGLPGPPPGAQSGVSLPPAPGQVPPIEAPGPAVTIPLGPAGPGLLSGFAGVSGRRVNMPIACQASGRAQLSVPTLAGGTVARARYRCRGGRATVPLSLSVSLARRVKLGGSVLGQLTFTQAGSAESVSVMIGPRASPPAFWMSDSGLACGPPDGGRAALTAPDFTDSPVTTIDVRPWLAWFTPATGWQWLGTRGPNASVWYRFTATPSGIAEWRTPFGMLDPWMWQPITIGSGHGTYVIAVFEAIYWYSRPVYVWQYARSDALGTYCAYS